MELLFILLVCAWAFFIMVRHITRRFDKSSSCRQECKNCPEIKESCNQKEKILIKERSEEKCGK